MRKLNADWTLTDVIARQGSSSFETATSDEIYSESVSVFDQPGVVQGRFKTFSSRNFEVSMMELDLHRDLLVRIDDGIERLGTTVLLHGSVSADCLLDLNKRRTSHAQHMLSYSFNYQNQYLLHAGKLSLFNLNIKPAFFFRIAEEHPQLARLLSNNPEEFCLSIPLNFNRCESYQAIDSIYSTKLAGITKNIYVEGKAYELFAIQLDELIADDTRDSAYCINRQDRDKLMAINHFITKNFTGPLSLAGLARQFELNEFKLKKGYKILFATTVFGHIHQLRMDLAKQLLASGEYNIAEVAYSVGYSSPGNFSTAFNKMFHYPPSRLLQKRTW